MIRGLLRRSVSLVIVIIVSCSMTLAQSFRNVRGEYIYYPPEEQSLTQAKQVAVDRAIIQLLSDTYGTDIQATTTTLINNSDYNSSVRTASFAESSVRGEWIKTTFGPVIETVLSPEGMIGFKVTIGGRVREIPSGRTNVEAHILVNGTESRFEGNSFKEQDSFYVSFKSPVDGFLSIFLYDGNEDVFCLLPYSGEQRKPVQVQGGKEYVFFSRSQDGLSLPPNNVDEIAITCSAPMEVNRVYLVFSPIEYGGANTGAQLGVLPRSLSNKDFQTWLAGIRTTDKQMVVKSSDITIKR